MPHPESENTTAAPHAPDRPRLRPVRLLPGEDQGERYVVLEDPLDIAPKPIILTPVGAYLANYMDGEHTVEGIADAASAEIGATVPVKVVASLRTMLDGAGFLEGPGFAAQYRAVQAAFAAAPVRQPHLAGKAYPADPQELRHTLDTNLAAMPARPSGGGALTALVAPHLDPRVAGTSYAAGYRELAARAHDAEVCVILGTAHAPLKNPVAMTRKAYATPLGEMPADLAIIDALRGMVTACDVFEDELNHRTEHAIEFQAVWLRHVLGPEHPMKIVPILVGGLHAELMAGREPGDASAIGQLAEALRLLRSQDQRRWVFVAGVDLAHVGLRFGDAPLAQEAIPPLETADRAFLETVLTADEKAVFAAIAADGNARNVCGFGPLYALTRTLNRSVGTIHEYGAWYEAQAVVTYSAATLAETGGG